MVNWQDEDVSELISFLFDQMLVYILGFYGWQFLSTLHHVEWPLLTRNLKFHFVYVPYLLGRYTLLAVLVALVVITQSPQSPIDCKVGMRALSSLGNISAACASTNLVVRTLTLWKHKRLVQAFLILLATAQWMIGLTIGLINVKPSHDNYTLCEEVSSNNHHDLVVFFSYTVVYEITILIFTIVGLGPKSRAGDGRLWGRVYTQGIWYFITTVMVNVPAMVFAWLDLSSIMDVFLTIPATTISVMASSAAFTSLMKLKETDTSSQAGHMELDDATSYGKAVGQFTTHVDITPSLFIDSSDIQEGMSFNTFSEGVLPTSRFEDHGGPSTVSLTSYYPPAGLGSPTADVETLSNDITETTVGPLSRPISTLDVARASCG